MKKSPLALVAIAMTATAMTATACSGSADTGASGTGDGAPGDGIQVARRGLHLDQLLDVGQHQAQSALGLIEQGHGTWPVGVRHDAHSLGSIRAGTAV